MVVVLEVDDLGVEVGTDHGRLDEGDLVTMAPTDDPADRVGDVGRREARRGHLVQQRLERVEVVAVHQRDVEVFASEGASGGQPAEPRSDDHHPRSLHGAHLSRLGSARLGSAGSDVTTASCDKASTPSPSAYGGTDAICA